MSATLQALLALLTALSAAAGGMPSPTTDAMLPAQPAIVAPALDSDPASPAVEIKGQIQSINGNVITVDGKQIAIAKNARIQVSLTVGAFVKAEGSLVDGVLVAREIQAGDEKGVGKPEGKKSQSAVKPGDDQGKHTEMGDDKNKSDDDKNKLGDDKSKGDDKRGDDKRGDDDDSHKDGEHKDSD